MVLVASSLPRFLLEGFEKGDDEDNDDKDKRKGGEDSAGLQAFEAPGPQEDGGRQRLNNAPGKFDPVGWVETTVGGECPQHEGGRIR